MPTFNPTNLELFTFYEQMKNDFENFNYNVKPQLNLQIETKKNLKNQKDKDLALIPKRKKVDRLINENEINNLKTDIDNLKLEIESLEQKLKSSYTSMHDKIVLTQPLDENNKIISKTGIFCEKVIYEIILNKILQNSSNSNNINKISKIPINSNIQNLWHGQENFEPDGSVINVQNSKYGNDIYIESKCYGFGSGGTADEKLPGFFDKARLYDKPVLLVLAGIHELWGKEGSFYSNVLLALSKNPSIPPLTAAEQQEINDSFIGQAARQLMQKTTPEGTPWLQITTLSEFQKHFEVTPQ